MLNAAPVWCVFCLIPVWQSLEQLTKLWQEIHVCAYLSTHIRFTFTLYTMNSTQENHLSQFVLDGNKTRMSVRWNEPTAGGVSFCWTGRILLQQNRQKENLWNQMCGINRGCLNVFCFMTEKRAAFHLSTAEGCGMWLTGLTGRQNTKTIHSSVRTSFLFTVFFPSICSQHLNLLTYNPSNSSLYV